MKEEEYQAVQNAMQAQELNASAERIKNMQQEVYLQQEEKGMIKEQLDLGEELERIDYLLRGYTLERDKDTGDVNWVEPDDKDMIILSDYGVHLIRNTIAWYINKNTLLSNYTNETILSKMEDFANDLNDTIFMEYEKVFQYPTFEECKAVLNARIENRVRLRTYAKELLGAKVDAEQEQQIKDEILKELEPLIEKEMEKVKLQIIKNKLKRFMIIIREVQDAVHSTYLRAFMGQERKTLREHAHITETRGGIPMPRAAKTGVLDYFKRR